jgi:hypothetical protein
MPEPLTIAGIVKSLSEAAASLWANGALLLWCLTVTGAAVLVLLGVLSWFHVERAQALLVAYGTETGLAVVGLCVFASFKTLTERAARPLSFIAREQQSHWSQTKQPSGPVYTAIALDFQVTNVSDGSVMLSAVRLARPWVRRRHIVQTLLLTKEPKSGTAGSTFPVLAHSLTTGHVHITIDHQIRWRAGHLRIVI